MKNKNSLTSKFFFLLTILILILISLSALSCTEERPLKKYTVGIINPNSNLDPLVTGFKEGMTAYGYVEGENIEYIDVNNAADIDSAFKNFKNINTDLVLTVTTPPTKKAVNALKGTGIPVVFGTSFDPVRGGIVRSLTNQEGNVTGIKVGGNMSKVLEWLLAVSPDIKRVFVPVKFDTSAAKLSLEDLGKAADKLNIDLVISEVETLADLQNALTSMPEDINAVIIVHSIFVVTQFDTILTEAMKRNIPTGSGPRLSARGAIISYGQRQIHSGKRISRLVHKVLQGAPASSIPVELADFFLGINLKTAREIGIEVPRDILDQADFIVR